MQLTCDGCNKSAKEDEMEQFHFMYYTSYIHSNNKDCLRAAVDNNRIVWKEHCKGAETKEKGDQLRGAAEKFYSDDAYGFNGPEGVKRHKWEVWGQKE